MLAPPAAQGAEELAGCAAVAAPACNAQGSTAPGPEQFPREQAFEQQHAAAQEQSAQRQNPDVLAAAAPRQAAAAGDSSGGGGGSKGLAADDEEGQEGEGFDAELGTWLTGRLQRMQPGAELDHGSVRVLGRLLDELAARVLDEACRVNAASAAHADADAAVAGGTESGPAAQAGGGGDDEHEAQRRQKLSTLTSLDIHKVGRWQSTGSFGRSHGGAHNCGGGGSFCGAAMAGSLFCKQPPGGHSPLPHPAVNLGRRPVHPSLRLQTPPPSMAPSRHTSLCRR